LFLKSVVTLGIFATMEISSTNSSEMLFISFSARCFVLVVETIRETVAVETHGPLSISSVSFLVDLGRNISERTGEPLEVTFFSSGSVS